MIQVNAEEQAGCRMTFGFRGLAGSMVVAAGLGVGVASLITPTEPLATGTNGALAGRSGEMRQVNGIDYWAPDNWCNMLWADVLIASETGYYAVEEEFYTPEQILLVYNQWRFDATDHCIHRKSTTGGTNYKTLFDIDFDWFDEGNAPSGDFLCDRDGDGLDADDILWYCGLSMHANSAQTWTVEDFMGLLKIFAVEWLDSSECLDGDPPTMDPEGLLLCDAGHRAIQSRFGRRMRYWEMADLLEASEISGRACDTLPGGLPYSKGDSQQFMVDRDGDADRDLDDLLLFMAESELCARAQDPPYVFDDEDRLALILHWLSQPWITGSEVMCWEYVNWGEHVFARVLTPDEVGDILGEVDCDGDYRDPRSGGWRPPGEGWWSERLPTCEPCIGEFPPIAPGGGDGGGEGTPPPWPRNDNNNIHDAVPDPLPPDPPDNGDLEGPLMVGLGRGQKLLPGPGTPGWNEPPQEPPSESGGEGLLMILPPPGWNQWAAQQTPPGDLCEELIWVPVDPVYGHKMEAITDLRVQVPGPDFYLTRSYSSHPGNSQAAPDGGAGMVGENWSLNLFYALRRVGAGDPQNLELDAGHGRRVQFSWDQTSSKWLPSGTSTQYVTASGGLFTLTEPGLWEIDFYDDDQSPFDLLIKERRDAYGNKQVYDWRADTNDKEYLQAIYLNGTSPANADATVQITYDAQADMRVKSVRVIRRNAGGQYFETQRVAYTYFTDTSSYHDAVGTEGDLVQVVHRQLVDRSETNAPAYREWVTQYRYHGGLANETSDDPGSGGDGDGFLEKGSAHQLRAVILPEQVEWFVQQRYKDNPAEIGVLSVEALDLLAMSDAQQVFSTIREETLLNLASKVVAEYETSGDKRVKVQHLQAACGCAGSGAESVKYEYSYFSGTVGLVGWKTTRIDHLVYDEGQSTHVLHRRSYFDAEEVSSGAYYIINRVIEQPGTTPLRWVRHFEFTGSSRHLTKIMMPSATSSYTPSSAGSPDTKWTYAASTTAGLVYEYTINSAHRVESFGVRKGNGSNTLETIWELTWGTGSEDHLVTGAKFYRVAGSAQADDIQLITLDYGFHSGRALAWTEVTIEADLVGENGPGGSLSIYRLFDTEGHQVWRKSADDRMDGFTFDASTGLIATAEYNADKAGKPSGSAYTNIPNYSSWNDRHADGDSLAYAITYDLLGRPRKVTTPSGVNKYFVRELRRDDSGERAGILYPVEMGLPHILSGGSTPSADGPIVARWRTGSGGIFRESEFAVGADPDYHTQNGAITAFTLDSEFARATVQQDRHGNVESQRVWHDLARDAFHETNFTYDTLGRPQDTIAVTGTITRRVYDALDRLTAIQTGTSDANLETVVEFFYDHQIESSQPVSKVGDGNLTYIREHSGEMSGQDEIVRDTIITYDSRNRAFKVERPEKPHIYVEYDNLDRAIKSVLNSNAGGTGVGSNLSTRGLYTETSYSQRGLPYRTRVAIDPTQSSPTFLESHRWFDEAARVVGAWAPNSPGTKITYDGLGRVTSTYVTDRRGDAAPGTTGNYADVHASHASVLTGDVVLEQSTTRYITSGTDRRGLPDLDTTWVRTHDASVSVTGALSALTGGMPSTPSPPSTPCTTTRRTGSSAPPSSAPTRRASSRAAPRPRSTKPARRCGTRAINSSPPCRTTREGWWTPSPIRRTPSRSPSTTTWPAPSPPSMATSTPR